MTICPIMKGISCQKNCAWYDKGKEEREGKCAVLTIGLMLSYISYNIKKGLEQT